MKLSVVMPVYNEEKTVHIIVDKVLECLEKLPSQISDYEIVIVEDGSKDDTKGTLTKHYGEHDKIKLHFQEFNQGKGAAITKGFSETSGDIVLIQDADLSMTPRNIQSY